MPQPSTDAASRVPADVFAQLLRDARLSDRELSERLALAGDPAYWRGLAPEANILAGEAARPEGSLDDAATDAAIEEMKREGLCHLPRAIAPPIVRTINAIIDAVLAAGWPGVFAFIYDELWWCARQPAVARLVTGALGAGARQIPHVYTHIVPAKPGASGWPPHVDGPAKGRMSIWAAFSDATLDNGCMHAVPSSAASPEIVERFFEDKLTSREFKEMLHKTRAMPAVAGDVLGWTLEVIHWGGPVRRAAAVERRAVSFEFIAADQEPRDDERPLVALDGPLPSYENRLRAIAAGVLEYVRFERRLLRYDDLARQLLK
jgi:hypothetical protein